jgi:hypothetical protein
VIHAFSSHIISPVIEQLSFLLMLSAIIIRFTCSGYGPPEDIAGAATVGGGGGGKEGGGAGTTGAIGISSSSITSARIYGLGLACQRTNAVGGLIRGDPLGSNCWSHSEKLMPGTVISDPFKIMPIS